MIAATSIYAEYRAARLALRNALDQWRCLAPAARPAFHSEVVAPLQVAREAVYDRMTEHERLAAAPL